MSVKKKILSFTFLKNKDSFQIFVTIFAIHSRPGSKRPRKNPPKFFGLLRRDEVQPLCGWMEDTAKRTSASQTGG
jgi:hypothetical protein